MCVWTIFLSGGCRQGHTLHTPWTHIICCCCYVLLTPVPCRANLRCGVVLCCPSASFGRSHCRGPSLALYGTWVFFYSALKEHSKRFFDCKCKSCQVFLCSFEGIAGVLEFFFRSLKILRTFTTASFDHFSFGFFISVSFNSSCFGNFLDTYVQPKIKQKVNKREGDKKQTEF